MSNMVERSQTVAVTTVENGRTLATMTEHRYLWVREWSQGECDYPRLVLPRMTFISQLKADFYESRGVEVYDRPRWTSCGKISVWTSPKTRKEYCRLHADASGRLT